MLRQLRLFEDLEHVEFQFKKRREKYCPGCDEVKPLSYFYRHAGNPDGYGYQCANCENPDRISIGPVHRRRF